MFPVLASTLQIRRQIREEYQALDLFSPEHCVGSRHDQDFEGKVLVMSPDTLKESCWCAENQLWYAYGGFGSSPTASGLAVYAVGLADGEDVRWNRTGFTDVLDEQFLPDWARKKLLTRCGHLHRHLRQRESHDSSCSLLPVVTASQV